MAITDWCGRIGIVALAHLIVEDNLSGLVVPDLDPEFINATTLGRLTINNPQDVFVPSFIIDLAEPLKLSSGP
jgi:hypothetical protein